MTFLKRLSRLSGLSVCLLMLSPEAGADEPPVRYGVVRESMLAVEGGFTATYQHADATQVDDEFLLSFDLVTTIPSGPGEWIVYVEGSTTPPDDGVSSVLVEANADAGSALDRDAKGRLQVSALNFSLPLGRDSITIGLLDPTGFLDASEIANDETSQFIATDFVNNPTIEFPDYTLGGAYHHEHRGDSLIPGYTLVLTGSHGLADNPERSYAELVDLHEAGKGAFAAAELYWELPDAILRIGFWGRDDDHEKLHGDTGTEGNYGLYGVADITLGGASCNLRWGLANGAVSAAADFLALAVEYPLLGQTLGVGLSRSGASADLDDGRDAYHAEVYLGIKLTTVLRLTPSIQYLKNSGLTSPDDGLPDEVWVAGLRATYGF